MSRPNHTHIKTKMAKPTLFVLLFSYLVTTVLSNETPPSTRDNDTSPPSNTPQYFNPPFDPQNPSEPRISKSGVRLVTLNELKAHGANGTIRPLWLAILGRVFDVDRAYSTHYGPDGGYSFFTGIDGSKAFVTGEFNDEGLTDDILDLDPLHIEEIENWSHFYDKDYTYVGKLIGRYYDETGNPTKYWYKYQKKLREADAIKIVKRAQEQQFPPCNSRFTPEDGGTVYCSKKSGGIERDWEGLPRRYFIPGGKNWRCACVHDKDLNDPHIKLYPGCDPTAEKCKIDKKRLKEEL